jgi:uncharacterized membrane protein YkvA (DUF1232 family)
MEVDDMGLGVKALLGAYLGKKIARWLGIRAKEGVAQRKKWPFIVIPLLYWILPDFIPFMPWDDIVVTLVSIIWYKLTESRNTSYEPEQRPIRRDSKDVIDIEGKVVD